MSGKIIRILILVLLLASSYGVIHQTGSSEILIERNTIEGLIMEGYTGLGVKIAVIDTGLNDELLDNFAGKGYKYYNATNSSANISDNQYHGTWVTCIMHCVSNDKTVKGLIPNADFVFVKVTDELGKIQPEYVVDAIKYAINEEVDIINLSIGTLKHYDNIENAIKSASTAGIIIVCSFGDDIEMYPAKYSETFSVGVQGYHLKADVKVDLEVFKISMLENIYYDYSDKETSSFVGSVFSSLVVLLCEKYNTNNNSLNMEEIEGMIK